MARRILPTAIDAQGASADVLDARRPLVTGTRDWQRTTFGPFSKRVLFALAEAFFTDPDEPADLGASQRFLWLVNDIDDFVSHAGPTLRWGTRIAIVLVEFAPLFFIGRFARCSSLPLEHRERYLAKVEVSTVPRVAVLVVMFKTLMTVLYFEHPEAAPHLGYDGRHERFRPSRASFPGAEVRK